MTESEGEELMVNMVLIRAERRASFAQALRHYAERIEDWQREQQYRRRCADDARSILRGHQAQHPDRETEQLTARISHEHARRIRVVAQEAEHRTCESQRECGGSEFAAAVRQDRKCAQD